MICGLYKGVLYRHDKWIGSAMHEEYKPALQAMWDEMDKVEVEEEAFEEAREKLAYIYGGNMTNAYWGVIDKINKYDTTSTDNNNGNPIPALMYMGGYDLWESESDNKS